MTNLQQQLDDLKFRLGEVHDLGAAASVLNWDQSCYMPPKGARARGEQLSTLSSLAHRLFTAPAVGGLLEALDARRDQLAPGDAALVRETRYDYDRSTRLPEDFVRRFSEAQSHGFNVWMEAKPKSDWKSFQPAFATLVEMLREKAALLGHTGSPYNALLEDYERGMTAERLRPLFADLAVRQKALVEALVASPHQPRLDWTAGPWSLEGQTRFSRGVLEAMGYDFAAGRRDAAPHPFCTCFDVDDVRITYRHDEDDLFSALMGDMHECGHALYDMGYPVEFRRTPLCGAPGLGIHESQSRLWENIVGRSRPFWSHFLPALRGAFPGRLDAIDEDTLVHSLNEVRPSLIRVEADEVTYNLHIIIRFELEVDLMEGKLAVADVPDAWNAKYKHYLGLDVPDHRRGCLQDIHWSEGMVGYFPTYALGNLYSAQLFQALQRAIPSVWGEVAAGRLGGIRDWLRANVHRIGRTKTAPEIIRDATGSAPEATAYIQYLETKYRALYRL